MITDSGEHNSGKIKVVTVPKSIEEEALSGGFSSLWLPAEIGFAPQVLNYTISMESGSRFLMIGFCVHGRGWFEYSKTRQEVGPGQVWIATPGIPFSYGSFGDKPWTFYWLHVTGARIAWFRNLLLSEGGVPVFSVSDIISLTSLLQKVLDILAKGFSKRNLDCASLVFGHLMAELRLNRCGDDVKQVPIELRLERVISWLKDHTNGSVEVQELAAMCNLSTSYFTTCFRNYTGYRVLDYFVRLKMDKACELLKNPDLPIKEIAATVGFVDQLYFSRTFKKVYQCPPQTWRNQYRANGEKLG